MAVDKKGVVRAEMGMNLFDRHSANDFGASYEDEAISIFACPFTLVCLPSHSNQGLPSRPCQVKRNGKQKL